MPDGESIDDLHERIAAERTAALPDVKEIRGWREYALGKHEQTLDTETREVLGAACKNQAVDNLMRLVLSAVASNMRLQGFTFGTLRDVTRAQAEIDQEEAAATAAGNVAPLTPNEEWAAEFWIKNHLPSFSRRVHIAAARDGDTYVGIVWKRSRYTGKGRPILTRELAWDGASGMWIAYDDLDAPLYAVKQWTEKDPARKGKTRHRRTVWFEDRVERYVSEDTGGRRWQKLPLTADPDADTAFTSNRFLKINGEPLGIPVIHFGHGVLPNDGSDELGGNLLDSRYGRSEFAGGLKGVQDLVNDNLYYGAVNTRFTGAQMVWATGYEMEAEPEGFEGTGAKVQKKWMPTPGALLTNPNADGAFGAIAAGDSAPIQRARETLLQVFSDLTDVPIIFLGGNWPSGVAIYQAYRRWIEKMQALQEAASPAWGSVLHMAMKYDVAYGGRTELDLEPLAQPLFAAPSVSDPVSMATTLSTLAPVLSDAQVLRELGYTADEIKRIQEEKVEDKRRAMKLAVSPTGEGAAQVTPTEPNSSGTAARVPSGVTVTEAEGLARVA